MLNIEFDLCFKMGTTIPTKYAKDIKGRCRKSELQPVWKTRPQTSSKLKKTYANLENDSVGHVVDESS